MEKIIHSLINNWIKGVDTYTHNGSTWLIFTESKKWVIELTDSKTLWYNYNFFKQIFEFTSLDVVDNQQYITKWVEDNIINGVKHTITSENRSRLTAENIIENGVRHTEIGWHQCNNIDDAIEKGVRAIYLMKQYTDWKVDEIVKETLNTEYMPQVMVEDTIQNGIKETKTPGKDGDILSTVEWMEENNSSSYTKMINDVIENGVKETKHSNKYDSIGPVFKEGKIENVIVNGDKVSGTFVGGKRQKENIESVIGYGTKNPTD
jgi:hypothetical protein